jgi:hypothetical protein
MEWWGKLLTDIAAHGSAMWGILGTLLGAMVASSSARKMAADRLRHEDRTRFHDKKLVLYTDFIETAYRLYTAIQTCPYGRRPAGVTASYITQEAAREAEEGKFQTILNSVLLLGGFKAREFASDLSSAFHTLRTELEGRDNVGDIDQAFTDCYTKIGETRDVMREELEPSPEQALTKATRH